MNWKIELSDVEKLEERMREYAGNVEDAINDVLHDEAGPLMQDSIRNLMPVSGVTWAGKKGPAKTSKSLLQKNTNLAVLVGTTSNYQYLYFPNDGTNTKRHAGQQFFFEEGGEAVKDDIIERCINKLTNNFEKGV